MKNLTIKLRVVLLGFLAIIGIAVAGGIGIVQLSRFNAQLASDLREVRAGITTLIDIESASIDFKTQIQEWKNILIRGNKEEDFARYLQAFQDEERRVQSRLQAARDRLHGANDPSNAAALTEIDALLAAHAELGRAYRAALADFDKSNPEAGKKVDLAVRGKDRAATEGMNALVGRLQENEVAHMGRQVEQARAVYIGSRNLLIALIAVSVLLAAAVAWATVRKVATQIAHVKDTTAEIRRDLDLTRRVPISGSDEMAEVAASINVVLDAFQQVVRQMKEAGAQVSGASDSLAQSVVQLSSAVEQQNTSTSAMAASMEEMAVSISHVSDSSGTAQSVASESLQTAKAGGEVIENASREMLGMGEAVQSTSTTMEKLNKRTDQIDGIVGAIREIADQTNLLALNAAIEAARAGEQGRGFAVVADEVRKLAERTSVSTKEIAELIGAIQMETQRVVDGMHRMVGQVSTHAESAKEASDSIVRICEGSQRMHAISMEIDSALKEQRTASDLIARQVEVISSMSEENTSAMGEAKAASEEMKLLSEEMHNMVVRFKA